MTTAFGDEVPGTKSLWDDVSDLGDDVPFVAIATDLLMGKTAFLWGVEVAIGTVLCNDDAADEDGGECREEDDKCDADNGGDWHPPEAGRDVTEVGVGVEEVVTIVIGIGAKVGAVSPSNGGGVGVMVGVLAALTAAARKLRTWISLQLQCPRVQFKLGVIH